MIKFNSMILLLSIDLPEPFTDSITAATESTQNTALVIIKSSKIRVIEDQEVVFIISTCEAVGSPVPNITWQVLNGSTEMLITVDNDLDGIEVEKQFKGLEASSQLWIAYDTSFRMPVCIATNSVGIVEEDEFLSSPDLGTHVVIVLNFGWSGDQPCLKQAC